MLVSPTLFGLTHDEKLEEERGLEQRPANGESGDLTHLKFKGAVADKSSRFDFGHFDAGQERDFHR